MDFKQIRTSEDVLNYYWRNIMKKFLLIIVVILLSGCGTKKMICQLDVNNTNQNYQLSGKYEISYQNNLVKMVKTTETYKSNNQQVLNYFDQYLEKTYIDFNKEYSHISYNRIKKKHQLTYKTVVDYSAIDVNKLINNGFIAKTYIKNKQITISGFQDMYESKGANCQ